MPSRLPRSIVSRSVFFRPRSFFLALALACALASALVAGPVLAQSEDDGAVRGRVLDAESRALVGAQVTVSGTPVVTQTDASGRFSLFGLAAGTQELTVSYLGFEPVTRSVEVMAGEVVRTEIVLDRAVFSESVTVQGAPILQGQARALNQQRTAANIQNVVAADQIGRFPDPNAAEATQRIPGVTLERDQGEGRYVIVRGTEARLNSMMINGERIPSPEGDVRNVALDVIPADLLEAIEVSKALTPDMDGDAIGGAVNLVTKRAPESRRLSATLGAGYNDLPDDTSATGNFTYGARFGRGEGGGDTGLLVSGSAMDTDRATDNFEAEYDDGALGELETRDYAVTRERFGATVDLDHQLSESSEILFHGIWNEFSDQEFRRANISAIEDGELERELKDRYEVQQIRAAAVEGHHLLGSNALVDWRLSWAYAEEEEPDTFYSVFLQEDVEFSPSLDGARDRVLSNPLNEDFGAYELDEITFEQSVTTEEDLVARVDLTLPITGESVQGLWKFGTKYRDKEKDRNADVFEFDTDDLTLLEAADGTDFGSLFSGRYPVGVFPDPNFIRRFVQGAERERDNEEDLADYLASEDTLAVYGLVDLQLSSDVSLLTGVRWESTDTEYDAFEVVFDEEGDFAGLTPVTGTNDYDEVLPSAHLRWALDERTNVRAAVSRSLARPNYEDLAPFSLILEEDREIERGNPDLDITTSWNLDLMWERYFETVGLVSVGAFHKDLSDTVFFFRSEEERGGETFDVIQPRNGDSAEVTGFELVYQNRFQNLDGWLSGLGLYFNATLADSEAVLPEREDARLPGQSDEVMNLALSYEKNGFSGRLSYNLHGDYLSEVGEEAAEDLWIDERSQLDLSLSQRLTSKMRLFLDVLNLTDEPFRAYEGSPDRPVQVEEYSWSATLGLKWDL